MALPDGQRGSTPFERFVQHIVQALTVAGLLGALGLAWSINAQVATMGERVQNILISIATLKEDARTDINRVERSLDDHEARIRRLEGSK